MKAQKCCICGLYFTGFGNNPAPVKNKGRCCDTCNNTIVIPTRIMMVTQDKNGEKANEGANKKHE